MDGKDEIRKQLGALGNKGFALGCMRLLRDHGARLTEGDLQSLQDCDESKSLYGYSAPVIREVASEAKATRQEARVDGKQRYYYDVFELKGRRFVVSNHWYDGSGRNPDNRTGFLEWVLARVELG